MKLAVFGGTGRVGRELVVQALAAGHDVTMLVHGSKPAATHPALTTVEGDAADFATVHFVVAGHDAVISTLGHGKDSADDVLARATENMIGALARGEGRRLVVLSSPAVCDPADRPAARYRAATRLMRAAIPKVVRDHRAQAALVEQSGLDWTLARGPFVFTSGPATGGYHAGPITPASSLRVARADLAAFLLQTAIDGDFVRSRPLVSR